MSKSLDSFNCRRTLTAGGAEYVYYSLPEAEKNGMKVVAAERFARTDTSVTPQALKLTSAHPDAMVVVASGSGAAMPEAQAARAASVT